MPCRIAARSKADTSIGKCPDVGQAAMLAWDVTAVRCAACEVSYSTSRKNDMSVKVMQLALLSGL